MGNSQSQTKDEPLVFYGSNVSMDLSKDLMYHLHSESQKQKFTPSPSSSDAPSGSGAPAAVDAVQIENVVNQRVEQALHRLFTENPELTHPSAGDPHRSLLDLAHRESQLTHGSTEAVAQELRQAIEQYQPHSATAELPAAVQESRRAVVACYRDHTGRPLDCWQEVEKFKQSVREAQEAKWKQAL
ncbi:hypothetical protein H4R33_003730 [Dimargaris cristalligena]|uniref:Uncharacterized protein n=1 Tax=Dimargaris cristalligena TaxID=215637 RepID=A0A4P9ZXS0_9FUNG|nr:hypothetical protein H4R33_003730 [Dimargaris cristalligena]RKP38515.1 hypothetical protein BJ085DRAFT_30469 [Dimargaris cristalligena]|eukprot:RKP38515.1 hypothetical protein BJ085DRAFT_30469 [Dimargaris cristalligena]